MFRHIAVFFSLVNIQTICSQSYTISGYVEDFHTGERIIGAYVMDSISKSVVQTNNYGYYTLTGSGKKLVVQSWLSGFRSDFCAMELTGDSSLNIKIYPVENLKEVLVFSSKNTAMLNARLGLVTIPVKQLTSIPALGETDLLKSIQSQAGIKGGIEGSAGVFVRGGGGGENLYMLDEVPLYNVSHLYGFFSVFNSSAIKDVKLLKGCFPARYGGRASSVIDVRSLDGNNKKISGELSLGIVSSRFTLEGPLFNDKTTFMLSARRSYFDIYANSLKKIKVLDEDFPDYYFYDLNFRLTHTFSKNDKIFLGFYNGKDFIQNVNELATEVTETQISTTNSDETSGWGNLIGSFRWNHAFGSKLFSNTTLSYSGYDYFTRRKYRMVDKLLAIDTELEKIYFANYKSDLNDVCIKTDFSYALLNRHVLLFGAGATMHRLNPGGIRYSLKNGVTNESIDTSFTNKAIHITEPFLYIEDEFRPDNKLAVNVGVRFSGFNPGINRKIHPELRVSVNYAILPKFVIKGGYSRMTQYMHLLSTSGVSMPTDIWVPSSNGLQPLISDQINAGIICDWDKVALFSVEVYNKRLTNTTDIRDGASMVSDLSPWYEKTIQGSGDATGLEISIEKLQGSFTGSIHYTLSNADRAYEGINNGKPFPFKYDRLHDFNISGNYQISSKWDFSFMWILGSGYPVTLPLEKYPANMILYNENTLTGQNIYFYPSRNNYRLPAYHRMDLGLHYKVGNRWGEHMVSFDLFNAYNRKNPVNAYINYSFYYVYLLPCIPSITYTLKIR